jgi:hypothetical protein
MLSETAPGWATGPIGRQKHKNSFVRFVVRGKGSLEWPYLYGMKDADYKAPSTLFLSEALMEQIHRFKEFEIYQYEPIRSPDLSFFIK